MEDASDIKFACGRTAIGDPSEADAIGAVFRQHGPPEDPVYMCEHYRIFLK